MKKKLYLESEYQQDGAREANQRHFFFFKSHLNDNYMWKIRPGMQ